jgi:fructan beta-fructosidase
MKLSIAVQTVAAVLLVTANALLADSTGVPVAPLAAQSRDFVIQKHYLQFPVKNGGPKSDVKLMVDGRKERSFIIELADGTPDWWAFLDVSAWTNKTVTVETKLPPDDHALNAIEQSDTFKGEENLYHETLRPLIHFSARRGWNNDPNGLCYYNGEYHLFFQHNPYGWAWGNMHWGHAVSKDMVHWHEIGDALAPDDLGPMFSGSAVVDWKNTSGFGQDGKPPMVLIYTASGRPAVQCVAYSTDGRQFTKYSGNPVIKQIMPGNRDPKVRWYEPAHKWILTLYVGYPTGKTNDAGRMINTDTVHFLSSSNLIDWVDQSQIEGFYECPDFFELPVDNDATNKKWVLTAANSDYMVGAFDGTKFTPETARLKGHHGKGFYAAQTFSDIPPEDGRRIQIGWLQSATPGMPFNQGMSLPFELKLVTTPEGPRLTWTPIKELETLRTTKSIHVAAGTVLKPGDPNPLAAADYEALEIRAGIEPGDAGTITFNVRGTTVVYSPKQQEIQVAGSFYDSKKQQFVESTLRAPAPLTKGAQRLTIYVDRTSVEVTAGDGLTFMPLASKANPDDKSVQVSVKDGSAVARWLEVHELKSMWE